MVDAAGAIYVIGGYCGSELNPYYYGFIKDVWVSTDGGARPVKGVVGGYSRGVL